jgi:hypothetical protein
MVLENGDVLVPEERGTGMVRLKPGDEGHAEWLAHLQRQRRAPESRAPEPRDREARATPAGGRAGRTAAGCGLGFIVGIAVVVVLLVIAVLVILSLVSDVNLPEIPGLPEDLRDDVPEDVPGG